MPAALAVNWEAVEAHAKEHGAREAARAYDLSENTVMARCRREGWLTQAGQVIQPLPKSMQDHARDARITPAQAVERTHASLGEKTRSRFARGIARGALKVANMRSAKVLAHAGEIKQLVDAGAKLHGWGSEGRDCNQILNIAFLQACGTQPEQAKAHIVEEQ